MSGCWVVVRKSPDYPWRVKHRAISEAAAHAWAKKYPAPEAWQMQEVRFSKGARITEKQRGQTKLLRAINPKQDDIFG